MPPRLQKFLGRTLHPPDKRGYVSHIVSSFVDTVLGFLIYLCHFFQRYSLKLKLTSSHYFFIETRAPTIYIDCSKAVLVFEYPDPETRQLVGDMVCLCWSLLYNCDDIYVKVCCFRKEIFENQYKKCGNFVFYFYAPVLKDLGLIVLPLSVGPSVCLSAQT